MNIVPELSKKSKRNFVFHFTLRNKRHEAGQLCISMNNRPHFILGHFHTKGVKIMQESYPIARSERSRPLPDENFLPAPREKKSGHKKSDPKVDLMLVQLILCAAALLGVFGCKLLGGELYDTVRTKYITLVCDQTSIHQVIDAMSNRLFSTESTPLPSENSLVSSRP